MLIIENNFIFQNGFSGVGRCLISACQKGFTEVFRFIIK